MTPKFRGKNIAALCPQCAAVVSFDAVNAFAQEHPQARQRANEAGRAYLGWVTYKCAGCGRGGQGEVAYSHSPEHDGILLGFTPRAVDPSPLPASVPEGVVAEFREAEKCIASETWRAASALFRSALEKALRVNGYTKGSLADRIDAAAADTVITAARSRRAHEDVRVLGNEVVHDEWRAVTEEEVELAHHYVHRVIEDFYDDRAEVEKVLKEKGRL